ncbi:MAG: hypothetical protein MJ252_03670 [archaeon]|nr:hypothetical protein [archaeon]
MEKKEIKPEIDEKSLQVANDLRPMLEQNLCTHFNKYVPNVYPDKNHHPENDSYSLGIMVDSNKTIYVSVLKVNEEGQSRYKIIKLEVIP